MGSEGQLSLPLFQLIPNAASLNDAPEKFEACLLRSDRSEMLSTTKITNKMLLRKLLLDNVCPTGGSAHVPFKSVGSSTEKSEVYVCLA